MTPSEIVSLLVHYTLFTQEPVANLQSRNNEEDKKMRGALYELLNKRVLTDSNLQIHETPQDGHGNGHQVFYGDLMILKAYHEGKHGLGQFDFEQKSQFMESYSYMDVEVRGKIDEFLKNWKEVKNGSAEVKRLFLEK